MMKRKVGIISACASAGLLLGASGGSLAMWKDTETLSGAIGSGYEYFAAGRADHTTAAVDHRANVTIGKADAAKLLDDKSLAIPLQTDSLSQGNKGLSYTVDEPEWSGIFGAADVSLFRVAAESECAVVSAPAGPTAPDDLTSTPVSADYSTSTTNTVEFWCLVATLPNNGTVGDYKNTVTATAEDPAKVKVKDDDSWNAKVDLGLDPKAEADHVLTFTYETFRPGDQRP